MRYLVRRALIPTCITMVMLSVGLGVLASESAWDLKLSGVTGGSDLGAYYQSIDAYDSLDQWSGTGGQPGYATARPYHQNGPDWNGQTGFYHQDVHAPLTGGRTSTTWWNIYLWAQDYWNGGDTVSFYTFPYPSLMPPPWYQARLYLDYVPPQANWDGPWVFDISVTDYTYFDLPIVAVSNPLDGVRMHLTVATPEPSSLLAFAGGLAGIAGLVLRRRRK